MKRAGNVTLRWERVIRIEPSSSGCRSASSAAPRELRELVQEEHAVVGEARLAGTGERATADEPGARRRVVRRPKRAPGDQRLGAQQPGGAVHARHFERLVDGERRQDRWQAARRHRLSASGWPDHQDVVTTRRGDLEGALEAVVAPYLREVDPGVGRTREQRARVDRNRRRRLRARQEGGEGPDRVDRDDLDRPRQRRFARARLGHDQPAQARAPAGVGHRERAAHRPHAPVEAELAAQRVPVERFGGQLPRRDQQRRREAEVEAGPGLADVGRARDSR